ncbi:zinc finger CCCH domain-containing protein 12-like protein [Carex littledalei]|uniref:Zinc finger CCCH domain-containing protein 12-like protein n=1 Tax=Carex littledalei TaxID=544730 RepID=A0A833VYC3_9POAL|nr:zinc finger CCCH domain-containing protein 12-like protein [Carex littledalei]
MDFDASPSLPAAAPLIHGGAIWQQLSMTGSSSTSAIMDTGAATDSYPERPGEPDCSYYLRTGLCRFSTACKFNHPPDRKLAIAAARLKEEYPERVGQPECQFYLKTGTCKFGPTCKFHHPKDKAGIVGRAQLNSLGYPLRPGEKECAYYLRTLECKFGMTCKFHHPNPSSDAASVFSVNSNSAPTSINPGQSSYSTTGGGLTSWPVSKSSFMASPRWEQGASSSYAQLMVPQGLVPLPSWNAYAGQMLPVSSGDSSQQHSAAYHLYSPNSGMTSHQGEASGSNHTASISVPPQYQSALHRENVFPEQPDQPECQYYMKTGDCKFGVTCKFHHPSERRIPPPDCLLSPLGLPLRPGEIHCKFYSRYGICKFGPNCKFDHPMATPMGVYAYGYSPASLTNMTGVNH